MNTKQVFTQTALAAAILIGTSSAAHAGALASSIIEIDNLIFSQGGTTLDSSNFSTLGYTSHADADVKLTGYTDISADGSTSAAGVPLDLYSCLGDCSLYTDNQFGSNILSSSDGLPINNYSIADQLELNAPISGLTDANNNPVTVGATLGNASQAGVIGDAVGSSISNNVLGATWTFTGISGKMDITYDLSWYLETFVTSTAYYPTNAHASYEITWKITDLLGNSYLDEKTSESRSSLAPWANGIPSLGTGLTVDTLGSTTGITLQTAALDAGTVYTLSAAMSTKADVTSVPEPTTLALLGISLLGFGAARRRRTA